MKIKILILFSYLFVLGCSGGGLFASASRNAETSFNQSKSEEKYQNVIEVSGKPIILQNYKKTSDINRVRQEKELNPWQKFCRWIANLSILAVVVSVGGLFMGTTAPIVWIWTRYQKFRKALSQTVQAIEKSNAVNKDTDLKAALSTTHDNDTKMLIDDIRRKA